MTQFTIAPAAAPQVNDLYGPHDPPAAFAAVPHVAFGWIADVLHKAQVWTEAEWAAMPADDRPAGAQVLPGLGYVRIAPALDLATLGPIPSGAPAEADDFDPIDPADREEWAAIERERWEAEERGDLICDDDLIDEAYELARIREMEYAAVVGGYGYE